MANTEFHRQCYAQLKKKRTHTEHRGEKNHPEKQKACIYHDKYSANTLPM